MGSKSNSTQTDSTSTANSATVIDRRTVQEQGNQILDSLIVSNDDKVVGKALAEVRLMFDRMLGSNSASTSEMAGLLNNISNMVNKNQIGIQRFGLEALEKARMELERMQNQGTFLMQIADESIDKAMTMAEQVARDQAANQRQALEIVAQYKAGDNSETLTGLSTLIMAFSLLAMLIAKKRG